MDQCICTLFFTDNTVQILEAGQWNRFFFKKNCCGFAATLRIVICIVWFWTYSRFWWWGEEGYTGVLTLQSHLSLSFPWCTFKWRVIRIFYWLIYVGSCYFLQRPPLSFLMPYFQCYIFMAFNFFYLTDVRSSMNSLYCGFSDWMPRELSKCLFLSAFSFSSPK